MTIQELKNIIEKKIPVDYLIIFNTKGTNDFIPNQYIRQIAEINKKPLFSLEEEDLQDALLPADSMFGVEVSDKTRICRIKTLNTKYQISGDAKDVIIICDDIAKDCAEYYSPYTVQVPALEEWQIKDYMYSQCEGVDTKNLDYLIKLCNADIYRLDNEAKKLNIFNKEERKYVFDDFVSDGMYSDLTNNTVFNLIDALMHKRKNDVVKSYNHLLSFGVEPMGLLILLYKQIKNIIYVVLQQRPDPDNTGLTINQIRAINRAYSGVYTQEQLLDMFNFITDFDRKIKIGEVDMNYLIDYLIVFMLLQGE